MIITHQTVKLQTARIGLIKRSYSTVFDTLAVSQSLNIVHSCQAFDLVWCAVVRQYFLPHLFGWAMRVWLTMCDIIIWNRKFLSGKQHIFCYTPCCTDDRCAGVVVNVWHAQTNMVSHHAALKASHVDNTHTHTHTSVKNAVRLRQVCVCACVLGEVKVCVCWWRHNVMWSYTDYNKKILPVSWTFVSDSRVSGGTKWAVNCTMDGFPSTHINP